MSPVFFMSKIRIKEQKIRSLKDILRNQLKMNTLSNIVFVFLSLVALIANGQVYFEVSQPQIPVLVGKEANPVLKLIAKGIKPGESLEGVKISLQGTTNPNDIETISLFYSTDSKKFTADKQIGTTLTLKSALTFTDQFPVPDEGFFWVSVKLKSHVDLLNRIAVQVVTIKTSSGEARLIQQSAFNLLRVGIALRKHNDDGVHTYRIPGLTTTKKGTLLAVYDVRRKSDSDLQGDIDIGLSRSADGGNTWEPMKIVLDRGTWGGLPQKFNGVSDPCILTDLNTGKVFVAALWMHGVLDKNGKWIEGLTDQSTEWNHQWRNKGSQPGFGEKETAQFLISQSRDDGKSWSAPINLTKMCKQEKWWLFAPAPGHGITLSDGKLVFPAQGRDETGKPFSTILRSSDHGKSWKVGQPASRNTTENMAVQLSDGAIMLNIRDNRNQKDTTATNGRAVFVTRDLGQTWQEHPSSHGALIEPVCMAGIHKHFYTENDRKKSILLFSNPDSKTSRNNMTVKVSFDDGNSWPKEHRLLLDELRGNGYSCLTSIDENNIGILYESSQADLVFQKISLDELLKNKKIN
jgi:sialidase-1